MSKQKMIVYDDQLLIDFELVFKAIREEKGDWQKVEKELYEYLKSVGEKSSVILALMGKTSTKFVCQNCGNEALKWAGRCNGARGVEYTR